MRNNKKVKEKITKEALQSGYKADEGKPRFGLIPPEALREVAEIYTKGANKYCDYNWMLGMDYHRVYDAMQRHANAFWSGEQLDPVDGQHHLSSVIWGALTLLHFDRRPEKYSKFDDRPNNLSDENIRNQVKNMKKANK